MDASLQFLFKYKPFLFRQGSLTFDSSLSAGWLLLLLPLVVGIAFGVYRHQLSRNAPRGRTVLLIGLRALSLFLLTTLLFRPSLHVSTHLPRKSRVVMLIDQSKSMNLAHGGGHTRWEAVRKWLDPQAGSVLADLEERFQLQVFQFAQGVREMEWPSNLQPTGAGTNLETALSTPRENRGENAPLAGAILISDGADNLSKDLQRVLAAYRREQIPVHTVGVGEESFEKDIQVSQVTFAPRVLPESTTRGVVSLNSVGYPGKKVSVELREAGTLIASQPVTLAGSKTGQIVELSLRPQGTGLKHYTVSVAPQPGEAIELNNSQYVLLDVEDSRPKILYLEGTPRWEFKFIRQAVQADPNLQLVTLLRTSDNKFYHQGHEREDNLASGFPQTPDELFQYKGLILGSIEAGFFTKSQREMMVEFVAERGGGFMMLGGRNSFDAGRYAGTAIANMLPVHLGDRDPGRSFILDSLRFDLTAYGKEHPALQLVADPSANARRWQALPQISAYNWVARAKPGAAVLARGDREGRRVILLAAHRYGGGRAIAFMPASSWHWQMGMPYTDQTHTTFWRQVLRWLVASASDPVQVKFDGEVYQEEETVGIEVAVKDASFNQVSDWKVEATVTSPGAATGRLTLRETADRYSGEFQPRERGIYQVKVSASQGSLKAPPAEAFFLVTQANREFFNAEANPQLLQRVARETGGRYYPLDSASKLPEEISYADSPNSVLQVLPLWDMPFLFLLLGMFLVSEWFLRKRWGLI